MKTLPSALILGYREFKKKKFNYESERYRKLARQGQTPETMVIACCDSRAAPETIFNTIPGEIFVVRNVANLVPSFKPDGEHHATSAALEYAVQSLKVKNIVVMGHGNCGGIKAALDPSSEPLSPGDFIGKWMELLAPAVQEVLANPRVSSTEQQTALEHNSIRHSLENLRTFPYVSILEKKGRLELYGAWFDIMSGKLLVLNPITGKFSVC
jgi:carbonic anhydrase